MLAVLFLLPLLSACEWFENEPESPYKSGSADFSNYVAIGNSLASGFMDGDLYRDGQFVSYPYQISLQMALAGGGKFTQPLMVDNTGLGTRIIFDFAIQLPRLEGSAPHPGNLQNISAQGPFHNMGVPGVTVGDLTALTMNSPRAEAYYKRFAKSYGNMSIMDEVMGQKPSFVTLWIGSNDVLGYGLRGGDIATDPRQDITLEADFRTRFQAVVDRLGDTKGVVANIPDIAYIPYFDMKNIMKTFMKINLHDSLVLDSEQAARANAAIKAAELATGHKYGIEFKQGKNAALVVDPQSSLAAPYNFRQIQASDQVLLQLLADYPGLRDQIGAGFGWANADGVLQPIPHRYVLDTNERQRIEKATAAYNDIIEDIVSKKPNLHMVDVASEMARLRDGIRIGTPPISVLFTAEYLTGSFFSLDGVHPKGQGSAIIANKFIETINQKFGATLPLVDVLMVAK